MVLLIFCLCCCFEWAESVLPFLRVYRGSEAKCVQRCGKLGKRLEEIC